MAPSPLAFESTFDAVVDIYRLIAAMKADSADLRDSVRLSRVSIRESHEAMRRADELATGSTGEPVLK